MPGYHVGVCRIGNTIYEQRPGGITAWTIPPVGYEVWANARDRPMPLELAEAFYRWKREVHGSDPSIAASAGTMSSSSGSDADDSSSATGSMPSLISMDRAIASSE